MFNRRLWEGAELAVFDDADLTRTAIERTLVSGSHIDSATASYGVAGRKLLRVLGEALAAPGKPVAGPPLWDHLAATAAEYGEDLVALIERLPGRGFGMPAPLLGSDTLVLADVESLPGRGVAGLFTALREELPMFRQGNDFNSRIRIKNRSFEVARVRTIGSRGARPLADVPILVLDATPVLPLVQWVTEGHQRLPDVRGVLSLPDNVTVVQYASSSNGFRALSTPHRVSKVLEEIELERWRFPCTSGEEGLITSKQYLAKFASAGFSRVMTYGSVRGSNELADVRRLHVVGRPNPPPDETYFLAQVLHHDEEAVSPQAFMVERRYAGTNRGIDVVDYADPRMAALLHASREAEMSQVLHRARLFVRDDPVTVVLHTGHPVPGLRVDHLEQPVLAGAPINIERHDEAFERLGRAEAELRRRGDRCTAVALSREAKASRNTARKYLLETAKTGRAANQFADGGRRSGDK